MMEFLDANMGYIILGLIVTVVVAYISSYIDISAANHGRGRRSHRPTRRQDSRSRARARANVKGGASHG